MLYLLRDCDLTWSKCLQHCPGQNAIKETLWIEVFHRQVPYLHRNPASSCLFLSARLPSLKFIAPPKIHRHSASHPSRIFFCIPIPNNPFPHQLKSRATSNLGVPATCFNSISNLISLLSPPWTEKSKPPLITHPFCHQSFSAHLLIGWHDCFGGEADVFWAST